MQQQLKELNLDEPAFARTTPPCWALGWQTPEHEQFNSAHEDAEEDEGDATSILDAELDASMGEETDTTGCLACMPSAERHR